MKTKYIIGIIAAIVFVYLAVMSFSTAEIEYADFTRAKEKGKIVQIIGSWDKEVPYRYDSENNKFYFSMVDEKGNKADIIANGGKPNNFDIAPMVVIKGQYEGEKFVAKEILTKCPSKYEGQADDLKGKQMYN